MAVAYLETEKKGWLSSYHIVRIAKSADGIKAYYMGGDNEMLSADVTPKAFEQYWARLKMNANPYA